jgi:hypothetical protein
MEHHLKIKTKGKVYAFLECREDRLAKQNKMERKQMDLRTCGAELKRQRTDESGNGQAIPPSR